MQSNPTPTPLFTDLFYAAVIGFAISKIETDKSLFYYTSSFIVFAFVIEDWYTYYKRVVPTIIDRNKYNLYNIIIEFLILYFWSTAFSGAISQSNQFLLFFSFFMGLKWWAGVRHHWRRETLFSRMGISEQLYGASALASLAFFYLTLEKTITFQFAFISNSLIWAFLVMVNWTMYYDDIEASGHKDNQP